MCYRLPTLYFCLKALPCIQEKVAYSNFCVLVLPVVYPVKYPSNACLGCSDSGSCCWNVIYLEYQNVIGVLPVKCSNTKAFFTCYCLTS